MMNEAEEDLADGLTDRLEVAGKDVTYDGALVRVTVDMTPERDRSRGLGHMQDQRDFRVFEIDSASIPRVPVVGKYFADDATHYRIDKVRIVGNRYLCEVVPEKRDATNY